MMPAVLVCAVFSAFWPSEFFYEEFRRVEHAEVLHVFLFSSDIGIYPPSGEMTDCSSFAPENIVGKNDNIKMNSHKFLKVLAKNFLVKGLSP